MQKQHIRVPHSPQKLDLAAKTAEGVVRFAHHSTQQTVGSYTHSPPVGAVGLGHRSPSKWLHVKLECVTGNMPLLSVAGHILIILFRQRRGVVIATLKHRMDDNVVEARAELGLGLPAGLHQLQHGVGKAIRYAGSHAGQHCIFQPHEKSRVGEFGPGLLLGDDFKHNYSIGIHVYTPVVGVAFEQFRGHEDWGSDHGGHVHVYVWRQLQACERKFVVFVFVLLFSHADDLGRAEISDLHSAMRGHQQIGRLQITMHTAAAMQILHSQGCVIRPLDLFRPVMRALAQHRAECPTLREGKGTKKKENKCLLLLLLCVAG
eukprot:m.198967 g.198967  ORF g.198967 m.198967 type:complete len:318 (-) comp21890_c0_seq1:61-1014(-)